MGSPAASADVQPSVRRAFRFRLHTAPEPAVQWPLRLRVFHVSYSLHVRLVDDDRVPVTVRVSTALDLLSVPSG